MKKNIGTIDRIVRILIAAMIIYLYFSNVISGTMGIILIAISAVLVITSIISFCPLFFLLGLKSTKNKSVHP